MYPIDTSSASPTQPTQSPAGPAGYYTSGNMGLSIPPTTIDQDALNNIQVELDNLVFTVLGSINKADQTQVLKAIRALIRIRLSANTNFYVNASTGSDSTGDGTEAKPWQTLQGAFNILQGFYDLAGWTVTVHCAGSFSVGLGISAYLVGQYSPNGLVFDGGNSAQVNVATNSTCFYLNGGGYTVQNFALLSNSGSTVGGQGHLMACNMGTLIQQGNNFGSATGAHLTVYGSGSNISCGGSYTISGSAALGHWAAGLLGTIRVVAAVTPVNIALTSTINFPGGFAEISGGGNLTVIDATFSGAATGYRYELSTNGMVFVSGAGADYFPGNMDGANDGTGLYQ